MIGDYEQSKMTARSAEVRGRLLNVSAMTMATSSDSWRRSAPLPSRRQSSQELRHLSTAPIAAPEAVAPLLRAHTRPD